MTTEQQKLLVELLQRQREIAATPTPPTWRFRYRQHAEMAQNGPKYSSSWFGDSVTNAERMRFKRALLQLESDGLIHVTLCYSGSRISRIKLTESGQQLAETLNNADD